MLTLITSYREASFVEKRTFDLYEDHLRVFIYRRFGDIHEQKIWLNDLRHEPSRSWVRGRAFETTVAWATLILILGLIAYMNTRSPDTFDPELLARGLWATVGFVLLVIVAYVLFPRRVEVAVFQSAAGIPIVAVARRGNERARFEDFVAAVNRQITQATAGAAPDTATMQS